MSGLAQVELDRDIVDEAAERAAAQGLSVTAYLSLVLRRTFERQAGDESVLAYDHVDRPDGAPINREPDESDEDYARRSALYRSLFDRK